MKQLIWIVTIVSSMAFLLPVNAAQANEKTNPAVNTRVWKDTMGGMNEVNTDGIKMKESSYYLKGGKLYQFKNGKLNAITKTVNFKNGTTVSPTGEVKFKNGTGVQLEPDERLDINGNIMSY